MTVRSSCSKQPVTGCPTLTDRDGILSDKNIGQPERAALH